MNKRGCNGIGSIEDEDVSAMVEIISAVVTSTGKGDLLEEMKTEGKVKDMISCAEDKEIEQ